MERNIKIRMSGVVFGLPKVLMPFNHDSPACAGSGEFDYEGNPDELASAYAAWCQQPIRAVRRYCGGQTTYEERCLAEPSVEVTLDGQSLRGHIRGFVHGNGFGAFDFAALLQGAATSGEGRFNHCISLHSG